MEDEDSVVF